MEYIEKLKRYKKLKAELIAMGKQITFTYNTYRSPNFQRIGTRYGDYSGPVAAAVDHIDELQRKYTACFAELCTTGKELESWLETIDPEISAIIRCHYLLGMSWEDTTKAVLGEYFSPTASRMRLRRYLKEKENDSE